MKKFKTLSVFLALIMAFGAVSVMPQAAKADDMPYTDVTTDDWFYSAVEYTYENGLMNGVGATEFAPQGKMSRAMLVTVLGRLDGAEQKETSTFPDLEANSWYSGYVGWAADNKIVGGYPDGTFCPDKSVSREEAAVIISRYISYIGALPMRNYSAPDSFTDGDSIGEWATGDVDAMRRTGILLGNNDGSFNPAGTLTRAESATILQRLREILRNLRIEDGVVPSYLVDGENFCLLGAWDMYYSGSALTTSYSGSKVDDRGSLPYLTKDDNGRIFRTKVTYAEPNLKGLRALGNAAAGELNFFSLDLKVLCINPAEYPYVRAGWRTSNGSALAFGVAGSSSGAVTVPSLPSNAESGASGWSYSVVDLSKNKAWTDADTEIGMTFIAEEGADVELLYLAMFKTAEEANAFSLAKYSDHIKNFGGERANHKKIDSATLNGFMKQIDNKIDEIEKLEDLDPSEITGQCWYVSSVHGNDSHDGKSPDTAFQTISALYYQKGPVTLCNAQAGDAVFFERGSVFDRQNGVDSSGSTVLRAEEGVTYAAYGKGEKPVFTGALDYSGSGDWVETEYKNIYKLKENIPVKENSPTFNDVGSIAIDDGRLWGVEINTTVPKDTFTVSQKTEDCGVVFNGEEYYRVEQRDCTGPDVLKNNLEYIQDYNTGALYMYCDKGNPGAVYKNIVIALKGDTVTVNGSGCTLHNLAVKHSGSCGISSGGAKDLEIAGCELEWIGGCLQGRGDDTIRFGNAYQNWGDCDGVYIHDCYINQVYDTGLTTQGGSGVMVNMTMTENVIENTIMVVEMFNNNDDEAAEHLLQNIVAADNYFRYAGFGFGNQRPQGDKRCSFFAGQMSFMYQENINHVFENNLCVYSSFHVMQDADIARGDHAQGVIFRNNTYVLGDTEYYAGTWRNLIDKTGGVKTFYPYTEQYLTYFTNLGIDRGSTFYCYEGDRTQAEAAGAYRYWEVD